LIWDRISDRQYKARPALLNPDDKSWVTIYASYDYDKTKAAADQKLPEANIAVNGRIANLKSFSKVASFLPPGLSLLLSPGISISIYGYGIAFFLFVFSVYFTSYFYIVHRLRLAEKSVFVLYIVLLGACLLSMASSEATTTYIFGIYGLLSVNHNVDHLLNAPWIVLNLLLTAIGWLYLPSGSARSRHA